MKLYKFFAMAILFVTISGLSACSAISTETPTATQPPEPPLISTPVPTPIATQIQDPKESDENTEDYSLLTEDNFIVRVYYSNPNLEQKDLCFRYATINKSTFSDDVIKSMPDVKISKAWYQKDRICIDLDKYYINELRESEWYQEFFNDDIQRLLYTFSSFPAVNEIQILIDGQADVQIRGLHLNGISSPVATKMIANDYSVHNQFLKFIYNQDECILKFYKMPTTADIRAEMEYINIDFKNINIDSRKYNEEVINKCKEVCGIKINNFWYDSTYLGMWNEQKKLYVDINSEEIFNLGDDFVERRQFEQRLFKTFSSLPEVSQIEFLVDGQRGYHDKLYLDAIFVVDNKVDSNVAKFPSGKTFEAKFYESNGYDYENQRETYVYTSKTVTWENMSDDTVKLVQDIYKVKINGIWYRGKRICVDINSQDLGWSFNGGSSIGGTMTHSFIQTFLSYPCVEEVELLVDGVKYVASDHFTFDVFKK